jgi:multiple sugar transport system permease protein
MRNGFQKAIITAVLTLTALLFLFPLVQVVTNSFMSEQEIEDNYGALSEGGTQSLDFEAGNEFARLKLIPDEVVLKQYYTVLVKKTQFLYMVWNSIFLVVPIILGQILVASMAAYAFAKTGLKFRNQLFFLYIVVMLMPFQVTLVPNYIVSDILGLNGTYWPIILPGIFGTFGVFLLKQYMEYIPDGYIEAATVDGAGRLKLFTGIVLPMSKGGIAALAILLFMDNWNMVEQPLVFIHDAFRQPLSIYLSRINDDERGVAFAAATLYMLPMLLIFLYGENYLVEGIQLSGIKG